MAKNAKAYKLSEHYRCIKKGQKAVVYNSLHGTSFLCNTEVSRLIHAYFNGGIEALSQSEKKALENETLLAKLRKGKLIIPKTALASKPDDALVNMNLIESGGLIDTLRLVVTRECNMKCCYCYIDQENKDNFTKMMSWPTAKLALTAFYELLCLNHKRSAFIRFFGGEPLLNWRVVKRCLPFIESIAGKIQTMCVINTNGTIFSEEIVAHLRSHNVGLAISVDGAAKVHDSQRRYKNGKGSFETIINNIENFIDHGIAVGIETTLGDHNLDHLNGVIDVVSRLNKTFRQDIHLGFQEMCFSDHGKPSANEIVAKVDKVMRAIHYAAAKHVKIDGGLIHFPFKVLLGERAPGFFCHATGKEISVEPNGDVYPCAALPMKLGHIDDLKAIFKKPIYHHLVKRKAGSIKACHGCDIEGLCSGGCVADAFGSCSDIFSPATGCRFRKQFFQEYTEFAVLSD